jgi:hypothetical protein
LGGLGQSPFRFASTTATTTLQSPNQAQQQAQTHLIFILESVKKLDLPQPFFQFLLVYALNFQSLLMHQ